MAGMTRRDWLRRAGATAGAAAVGAGALDPWTRLAHAAAEAKKAAPSERLRIGVVGVGNRGAANLAGVADQEIVALCDVDETILNKAGEKFPRAAKVADFRKLLDRTDLDALVVSTPDHTHAHPAVLAMRRGLHVYCEKPLAHSVAECRLMIDTARKHKVVTQMGTQIHAGPNYRRVVEVINSGAIGTVAEVHTWVNTQYSGRRPTDTPPVPKGLSYDLWLGPAPERPFHPEWVPFNWRKWWDFGGGGTADMACHHMDLPHWALELTYPTKVTAQGPAPDAESCPEWLTAVFEYPARSTRPPVKLYWYNGNKRPALFDQGKLPKWGNGNLFIGDKGMLLADYGRFALLPESDFAGFKAPPKTIPDSIGHYKEWVRAIREGGTTTCNFDYSGALATTVLLANVSYRAGTPVAYDPATGTVDAKAAVQYLSRPYRKGWEL